MCEPGHGGSGWSGDRQRIPFAPMKAFEKLKSSPLLAVACATGLVGIAVWVWWAIHVGNVRGGRAAVGVLITWPLLASVAALIAFAVRGAVRLARDRSGPSEAPAAAGGDADPGSHGDGEEEADPTPGAKDEKEGEDSRSEKGESEEDDEDATKAKAAG
jgi:hypothetical protein